MTMEMMKLCAAFLSTAFCFTSVSGFIPSSWVDRPRSSSIFTVKSKHLGQNSAFDDHEKSEFSRRDWVQLSIGSTAFAVGFVGGAEPSRAGLVQFPVDYKLMNTYHVMRSGESLLESQDILSSNPLFLTNREDALSEVGLDQVLDVCKELTMKGIDPSVVKYSIAAKCIDTANIIANEMMVGRNRLIPEYTFMDPRGVGAWDRQPLSVTEEAIWAMDDAEAGGEGMGARPPPNDDGTPNETLAEQAIRLRQLMSVLETQCSGDTILLVFSEGTSPALLMSLIAGIPLNRVHELNLNPGEIRYDITKENVLQIWRTQAPNLYMEKIHRGRENLKTLRDVGGQVTTGNDGISESTVAPVEEKEESDGISESHIAPVIKKKDKPILVKNQSIQKRSERRELSPVEVKDQTILSLNATSLIGLGVIGSLASLPRVEESGVHNIEDASEAEETGDDSLFLVRGVEASGVDNNEEAKEVGEANVDSIPMMGGKIDVKESPELKKMEHLVSLAPIDIPEMNLTTNNGSENIERERMERARIAMESYLEKDDGGEDWLALMSSIVNEE